MDEITAVRQLLDPGTDCPPESIATARTRLNAAMRDTTRGASRLTGRRIATPLRWSLAGSGLLAAAAVAAVVAGSGAAPPVRSAPPAASGTSDGSAPSAQQILLAAATRAARTPPKTGRYWHVKSLTTAQSVAPAGYHLTSRFVSEDWDAGPSGGQGFHGRLALGAAPSTPADERAWHKDGSPTELTIRDMRISTKAEKPELNRTPGPGSYLGESQVSLAELGTLPTDPANLRAWLEHRIGAQGGIETEANLQSQVFSTLVDLLGETPASPALRAAALRVLAATPHVRNAGTGRDDLGRTGTRIAFESDGLSGEMIIDPEGPKVLQIKRAAAKTSDAPARALSGEPTTLIITAEWTNDKPTLPTAP